MSSLIPPTRVQSPHAAALLSLAIGAGTVVATTLFLAPAAPNLADYNSDAPALHQADIDRALANAGVSLDRVIVSYAGNVDRPALDAVVAQTGSTRLAGSQIAATEVLRVPTGTTADVIARLLSVQGVKTAGPDHAVTVDSNSGPLTPAPDDPYATADPDHPPTPSPGA